MNYHDEELYDLQLTLESVIKHTPPDLYNEIVVIDDGSTDMRIRRLAMEYLKKPRFSKVKLYRLIYLFKIQINNYLIISTPDNLF